MASAPAVLDGAILALRRSGPGVVARAFVGGGLLGWVVLFAFYAEEVEGVRTLRPVLGVLLALAFWGRAYLLAGVARTLVGPLLPPGEALPPLRFFDVARTASVVAVGLFFWLWLPVAGSYVGVAAVAVSLLPTCLRGAVAPTWIARAGVEREAGLGAFRRAVADLGSDRGKGVLVELFLLGAGAVIFANLLACTAAVGLLGRSFLGMDVADLETFFSSRNTFVLLTLAVISTVALEPIRAAASAVLYVEARARREGFDLEASVRALARRRGGGVAVALVLVLGGASVGAAQAPATSAADEGVAERPLALDERDWAVQERVEEVLARSEFAEHEGAARGQTLRDLLERFFEWLLRDRDVDFDPGDTPPLAMPPGWVFGGLFAALVLVLLAFALRARAEARRAGPEDEREAEPRELDPRDRPPEAHLDDAAQLATAGAYREAFRALYLATLVALDRRGAIAFDRSRTNWHYLRSMSGGPTREAFHRFTALFDRKWYGDESTSEMDYRLGRELADRLCASEPDEGRSAAR